MINYRVVFTEDVMLVNFRAHANHLTHIRELSEDALEPFKIEYPAFKKKVDMFLNNLMKSGNTYPIDYIKHSHDEKELQKNYRHFVIKLVVLR